MNETEGKHGLSWPMILGVTFASPFIVGFVLIGGEKVAEMFKWLFLALSVAVVVLGIGAGAALPIRASHRHKDKQETVREIHHDGTRQVERWYGAAPGRLPLPADYGGDPFQYPAQQRQLLAEMYQNGRNGYTERQLPAGAPVAGALPPPSAVDDFTDDDDWSREALASIPAANDGRNDVPPPVGYTGAMTF